MKNQQINIFYFIFLTFLLTSNAFSQSEAEIIVKRHKIEFVNNKIKFYVIWASKPSKENGLVVGYGDRLVLELTNKQLQKIQSLRCDELLILLKDDKTDWGINLILYYIYDQDAALFTEGYNDTRQKWLRFSKANDIKFWSKKFSGNEE